MTKIYLALGTNVGKRLYHIRLALEKLKKDIFVEKLSSLYLTEPVGIEDKRWFVNCVLQGKTKMSPRELLEYLMQIEKKMGRVRGKKERRTIDLDILFYGEKVIEEKDLIIPHPRLHERRFVLLPLAEIEPNLKHPLLKKSVEQLLLELSNAQQVEKIESGDSS